MLELAPESNPHEASYKINGFNLTWIQLDVNLTVKSSRVCDHFAIESVSDNEFVSCLIRYISHPCHLCGVVAHVALVSTPGGAAQRKKTCGRSLERNVDWRHPKIAIFRDSLVIVVFSYTVAKTAKAERQPNQSRSPPLFKTTSKHELHRNSHRYIQCHKRPNNLPGFGLARRREVLSP